MEKATDANTLSIKLASVPDEPGAVVIWVVLSSDEGKGLAVLGPAASSRKAREGNNANLIYDLNSIFRLDRREGAETSVQEPAMVEAIDGQRSQFRIVKQGVVVYDR